MRALAAAAKRRRACFLLIAFTPLNFNYQLRLRSRSGLYMWWYMRVMIKQHV